jgi:hypothetical protein
MIERYRTPTIDKKTEVVFGYSSSVLRNREVVVRMMYYFIYVHMCSVLILVNPYNKMALGQLLIAVMPTLHTGASWLLATCLVHQLLAAAAVVATALIFFTS